VEIIIAGILGFLLGGLIFTCLNRYCYPYVKPEYEIETQIYEKVPGGKRSQLAPANGRREDMFTPSGDSQLNSYHASFR
jgi:hypothetical protein